MTAAIGFLLESLAAATEAEATVLSLLIEAADSRSTEFRVQGITAKIERLGRQQDRLRQLIATVKERERRRRDLEKIRQQNAAASAPAKTDEAKTKSSSAPEVFRDARGRVIGYRHHWGNSDYFLEPGGKWAGRETDGRTFTPSGKLDGAGKMGVRMLKGPQNARKRPRMGRQA